MSTSLTEGYQLVSICLVPSVKRGGGGKMVVGCFDGDPVANHHLFFKKDKHLKAVEGYRIKKESDGALH